MKTAGRLWIVVLVLAFVASCHVQGAFAQEPDFDEAVIRQVAGMLKFKLPAKMTIQYRSQKEMLEWYTGHLIDNCVESVAPNPANLFQVRHSCKRQVDAQRFFVWGGWEARSDGSLFILLYRRSTLNTTIHEFLHYWAHVTNPALNNHAIVDPMVVSILLSDEFREWLDSYE